MNLLTKQKETHRLKEWIYGCWGGGKDEGKGKFGIDMYTLLYLKWINKKDLLHSTGNSAQCYGSLVVGGVFGGGWKHVYVWLRPFAVLETITALSTGYTPIQNKKFEKQKIKYKLSAWRLWIFF